MTRLRVLSGSLLLLLCLGGLYAWSAFVPHLKTECGLTSTQTQVIFGFLIAVFTVSMVFAGKYLEKCGPKLFVGISTILLFVGYSLAYLSGGEFLGLFLGISICSGIAVGCGYVSALTAGMKWFPNNKGLITGISMASFGLGAIILASGANMLFERSVSVLSVFGTLAIIYFLLGLYATLVISFPEADSKLSYSAEDCKISLRNTFLYALFLAMFSNTFTGLLFVGNIADFVRSFGLANEMITILVSTFSIGNAVGRVVWGKLVDDFGQTTIFQSFWVLVLSLLGFLLLPKLPVLVTIFTFWVAFGFAASFVIHAALVAARYGVEKVGVVYPIVFLAYGIAGIGGPPSGGILFDVTRSHVTPLGVALGVASIGAILTAVLLQIDKKVLKDSRV